MYNWVIKNSHEDYWSNDDGWTEHQDCATVFDEDEKSNYPYLPLDGRWVPISEAPDNPELYPGE